MVIAAFLPSCGIGDFSSSTGSAGNAVTKVVLTGVVSTLQKPSLKPSSAITSTHSAPMGGGLVKVIDSKGAVLAEGSINSDGSYSLSVDAGNNYILRATKGNVCLKSYVEKANVDKTVTIDPTSSAVVKVLAAKAGKDQLGEPGQDVSNIIGGADIGAIIVAINNNALLAAIVTAIQSDISTNADYASTTVSVGVVSTAGINESNTIALSITITITIVTNGSTITGPSAPTGVAITPGDGQVTASWNSVTGATSFNLYYSTVSGIAGIKINGIPVGTSYTLTHLTNGTTYYFTITASKSGAESGGSTQVGATPQVPVPDVPGGLSANGESGQILLTWNSVTNATSYNFYWGNTAGVTKSNGTKISHLVGTSYTHTGLANGKTYYYILAAVDAAGEGNPSTEISFALHGWSMKASLPTNRGNFTVISVNGIVYLLGGYYLAGNNSPYIPANLVEAYDPVTDSWTAKAPMALTSGECKATVINGVIYVMGVRGTALEAYDPATNAWTAKASMPTAREYPSVSTLNGLIYAIGGYNSNAVESYNPASNSWSTLAPTGTGLSGWYVFYMNWTVSDGNTICLANSHNVQITCYDTITNVLFTSPSFNNGTGSASFVGPTALVSLNGIYWVDVNGAIGKFDLTSNTWSTAVWPNTSRQGAAVAILNGEIYVIGGARGNPQTSITAVEAFDPATSTWTAKPPLLLSTGGTSAVVNGVIYLFGGWNGNSLTYMTDVQAYQW